MASVINKYSQRLANNPENQKIHIPGVLSGLGPTSRYINKKYLLSTLHAVNDNEKNALDGYKTTKRYTQIISNDVFNQWSKDLLQSINNMLQLFSTSIQTLPVNTQSTNQLN